MTWGTRRALIIIVVVAFVVIFIAFAASSPVHIPAHSTLLLELEGQIDEQRPTDVFTALSGETPPVLHDFTDELDTAKNDRRIDALVVKIGPLSTGWGKLEEIRSHILSFRASGKPNICYLGGDGIGNLEYYVASACSEVWVVPTSVLFIHGMMGEAFFLRGSLDKLKIVPDYYHIAEYKTASNQLTEKKFTPAHREEVESIVRSIYGQFLTDVAASRKMDRAEFEKLVEAGPIQSEDAVKDKLAERMAYWDQVQDFVKTKTQDWNPVKIGKYRSQVKNHGTAEIAVVHATGLIVSGKSGNTPGGGSIMGGDSVAADIRDARENSNIKAIVLRIDSGGGSAVASEVIRREVQLAKSVKPVVASMSDVAASGGYWIAMSANKIVADPDTITASIGVLGGKLNVSGLFNMLGISSDYVATSDNATFFSTQQNFTPPQREAFEKMLHQTYAAFTQGVADGRKMKVEDVDKIGKGRIWSGAQAKDLGLVDELGGLDHAVDVAKQLAGIPSGRSVRLVRFPAEKTFFEMLIEKHQEDSSQWSSVDGVVRRLTSTSEPLQVRVPFELRVY